MEWEVNRLECSPRGYSDFGYSGFRCWGYDEDDHKFPIGPISAKVPKGLGKFYSVDLDISNPVRVVTHEDLRVVIEFNRPQKCQFEVHADKRVRGSLIC